MKNTRLIFIDGMSGAGKSTTAQRISNQLKSNKIRHIWLHEEVANHPIRAGEFSYGKRQNEEDMDTNCSLMVKKWEKLTETILESESIYIMEGCLYQNIVRYFLDANYPEDKIIAFYDRVMKAIGPVNPVFIFLRPQNVRKALENVYPIRGDWWKELILSPETEGYFKYHPYEGEESIYKLWEYYQELSDIQFDRYTGWKIRIDTTSGTWINHLKDIMAFIELPYTEENPSWLPESLEEYNGTYTVTVDGRTLGVQIFNENRQLYCKAFWPYMLLKPMEKDVFQMASFPIEFHFKQIDGRKVIDVRGNYDWGIVGERLIRVEQ